MSVTQRTEADERLRRRVQGQAAEIVSAMREAYELGFLDRVAYETGYSPENVRASLGVALATQLMAASPEGERDCGWIAEVAEYFCEPMIRDTLDDDE